LIRVTDRQKRAKATFTKPLTTHLTRGKGDFSCRAGQEMVRGKNSSVQGKVKEFLS